MLKLLAIIVLFLSLNAQAYLEFGDVVEIGNDQYQVLDKLGKGGRKTAFQAFKIGCSINCYVVIAVTIPPDSMFYNYNFALNDRLNLNDSPHVRREIPMARATIKGVPGETYVTVMEYG